MNAFQPVGIFGAGLIGCFVGGMLAAAGNRVVLLGRPAMAGRVGGGLRLTRFDGLDRSVHPPAYAFSAEPNALAPCRLIFVCVKSGDTQDAGATLARHAAKETVIVSLQNGVSNAATLRAALPGRQVLAAMIPFNVVQSGENRFHCASEGAVIVEAVGPAGEIAAMLNASGIPAFASSNIEAVLWGKMLINLNNAVNGLSGQPLKRQLADGGYRAVLAASVSEALAVLKAAGIGPARIGKVPPNVIPTLLRLPDWLFRIVAAGMLRIDDEARSSMAGDLDQGRKSEIDFLNGEIVRLGLKAKVPTPVNDKIVALVHAAFAAGKSPAMSADRMRETLGI